MKRGRYESKEERNKAYHQYLYNKKILHSCNKKTMFFSKIRELK